MERARAARPGVVLPPDAVARLCDRLDGAAAGDRTRRRTHPVDVGREIERRLGNRFALLTGGERTAPERHRTLLAVIDWSWNLLGGSERALLRRLSHFPDGFSADGCRGRRRATAPPPCSTTRTRSSTSHWSSVAEDRATGILRYRMLETVREFGDLELVEAGEPQLVREGMYAVGVAFSRETLARCTARGRCRAST